MLIQSLSLLGAFAILAAFAADQFGWTNPRKASYQVLNIVGGGILAAIAVVYVQYGFILLQSSWTVVSVWKLVSILRERGEQEGA